MSTYINVKDPPYNATDNDVTDKTTAIQSAINDAAGVTVYFIKETYFCGPQNGLTLAQLVMLGDNPATSVIKSKPNVRVMVTLNSNGSCVRNLGFIGPLKNSVQPLLTSTFIQTGAGTSLSNLVIDNVIAKEASWVGLALI